MGAAALLVMAFVGIVSTAVRWRSPVDLSTSQDLFAAWLGWVWVTAWSSLALLLLGPAPDRNRSLPRTVVLVALGSVCLSIALYYVLIVEVLGQSYDDFFNSAHPFGLARWWIGILTSIALAAAALAVPIVCGVAWKKRRLRS